PRLLREIRRAVPETHPATRGNRLLPLTPVPGAVSRRPLRGQGGHLQSVRHGDRQTTRLAGPGSGAQGIGRAVRHSARRRSKTFRAARRGEVSPQSQPHGNLRDGGGDAGRRTITFVVSAASTTLPTSVRSED